jgi:2-methylcitrate dehydratase PrpD
MAIETRTLAQFAAGLQFERLPAEVVDHHKLLVLDTLGCGLFGATTPPCRIVANLVESWGGKETATVWGNGLRVPAANAAFVNGVAVESYELDDTGADHTGCAAVTAALAMAEERGGVSGRTLLAAIVAGFEVKARIYLSGQPREMRLDRGYHDFGNSFAAAVATGRVLGFDPERMTHALCMAASQVGGLYHASMVKRMHPGWQAHGGVVAAQLVERGLCGVKDILERQWGGFFSAYYTGFDPGILVGGLGDRFLAQSHGFKYFAACGSKITTLHALLELRERHPELHERPETIQRIKLHVSNIYRRWSGVETDGLTPSRAHSVEEALMSGPYVVAVMLLMDRPEWLGVLGRELPYTDTWLRDPRIRALTERTEMVVDRSYADPVRVEVCMADGRCLTVDGPVFRKGHPQNPMTKGEVLQKFRNLASFRISADAAERIAAAVLRLDELADVRQLAGLLHAG